MTKKTIKKINAIKKYLIAGNPIWDVREINEVLNTAIEALQFVEHFDLLKEYQSLQEIVRCKDCDRGFGSPVCPISKGWAINKDTFFCAWGEKEKESEDQNE